jgi:hypothetical protein
MPLVRSSGTAATPLDSKIMKILTKQEILEWCRKNAIPFDDLGRPKFIYESEGFKIPADAGQRVALVKNNFQIFKDEAEILIWFTEWGIWPSSERMHIFERVRLSYGENRPMMEAPGHVFNQEEAEDALSFATLGVLFLWDCYVLNPKGTKVLFYSHDETGYRSTIK